MPTHEATAAAEGTENKQKKCAPSGEIRFEGVFRFPLSRSKQLRKKEFEKKK